MRPRSRDAMKLIRSITRRPKPEKFPALSDKKAFESERKRVTGYLPTQEEIAAECRRIREEKGDFDVQEAISELVSDEWDDE